MLQPDKHLDLNMSVFNLGACMLDILNNSKMMKYDELLGRICNNNKDESVKFIFPDILNFLFLFKKIIYIESLDAIELIQ